MSIFTAIIFLLSFTPVGFIHLGIIKATIVHVPVIIGSLLLGPKRGAILGGVFGLTSFISNTMTPVVSSFVFSPLIPLPGETHGSLLALVICFIPRILVGVVPYYVYQFLHNKTKQMVTFAISGVIGSMTNTVFVMGGILLLFQEAYAKINQVSTSGLYAVIGGIIATNGVIESIVAGVIVSLVCRSLIKNKKIEQSLKNLDD